MHSHGRKARRPGLLRIAWDIQHKGHLQFLRDQWRDQGELPHLRLGLKNLFLVIHPDHVRHVLLTHRHNFDKRESWEMSRQLLLGDGLIASTGAQWKRQRKLMSTFFTPKNIERYHALMLAAVDEVARRWDGIAGTGRCVDMFDEMARATAVIILRAMFGMDVPEERLRAMEGDVETMILFLFHRQNAPVNLPLRAPVPGHTRYRQAKARVHALIGEVMARRRAVPASRWPDDLLSSLMAVRDEASGHALADALVRDECIGIFVAGHETSARTLSFLWYALHANPDVAARLRRELDAVIPRQQAPALDQLRQFPYLTQTIKEVLRLYPPSPAFLRDAMTAELLDGVPLPAGAYLLLLPYLTHRHPAFWDDAERFDPDRFLPGREQALHPYAYYPFGGGNRVCIGNGFAMLEMSVLAAVLVQRFEAQLETGHAPQIEMGGTLMVRNGLPMAIRRRS